MTLTGASTTTNTLQVNQGAVAFSGAGTGQFGTYIALPTGSLILDNSGTNVNDRLGGSAIQGQTTANRVLGIAGGTVQIIGNATAATTETVGTLNLNGGVTNPTGTGTLTLQANAAQPLTFTAVNNLGAINQQSTAVFRGLSNTTGAGQANLALTGTLGGLGGTGANGTTTMSIRPDILGDASITGTGTGFLTKDTTTGFLRPLAAGELQSTLTFGSTNTNVNVGLTGSNVNIAASTLVGSLALGAGGGLAQIPSLMPTGVVSGLPITATIGTGGLLAQTGNAGVNVSRITSTNTLFISTPGASTLNIGAVIDSAVPNLTKTGAGTVTLNAKGLWVAKQTSTKEHSYSPAVIIHCQPLLPQVCQLYAQRQ